MTDATTAASASATSRELALEPGTAIDIVVTSGSVRLRGIDDDRLIVRNRDGDPLGDHIRIDTSAPGIVRVRDGEGTYKVGRFRLTTQHSPDLDIELPRSAEVSLRTMSGDIEATGLDGDSRWASASGDIRLAVGAGTVQVETMSGDATLDASGSISLGARTLSGDLRIRAPRFLALEAGTTSGDVRIEGDLDGAAPHAVNSVSGDVEVITGSPVRVSVQTLTGDIRASGGHVTESGKGVRSLVVGDGSVAVSVRTTSGDVRLRALEGSADPIAPRPPVAPEAPVPPVPPVAPEPPASPASPFVIRATDDPAPLPIDAEEDTAAWTAAEPVVDRREADRLEVLRALERGDLDIETAARRLEILEQAGPRYFRGWC